MNDDPKYTVSGNRGWMQRLDPEGNPIGERIEIGNMSITGVDSVRVDDTWIDLSTETITMDIELCSVNPDVLALLWGESVPYEVWLKRQPWWRRLLNRWWTR